MSETEPTKPACLRLPACACLPAEGAKIARFENNVDLDYGKNAFLRNIIISKVRVHFSAIHSNLATITRSQDRELKTT
jgi:hypothetical protein